ncbi:MAG: energy transducer TonB [Sphingomicrobium sp.]
MKRSIRFVAACTALAMGGSSPAQSPAESPIGNWNLERSPAQCVISRQYGPSEAPVTLGFKAPPLGDAVQMVIVRPERRTRVEQNAATITIGTQNVATTALAYPLGDRRRRAAYLVNLTGEESADLRLAGEIKVKVGGPMNRRFELRPMSGAWNQLDDCLERLRQTWNIGEGKLASPAQPIIPLGQLFHPEDYPIKVALDGKSGTTGVILLIDESGAVKDCTLASTSGVAVLDSRTCSIILSGGKFAPATFGDGKPAKSAYRRRIGWRLVE